MILAMEAFDRPTAFASLVKRRLYERGLTQEWLAQQVRIAPASLSRVMRGKRRPSAQLVIAISAILGLTRAEEQQALTAAGYGQTSHHPAGPRSPHVPGDVSDDAPADGTGDTSIDVAGDAPANDVVDPVVRDLGVRLDRLSAVVEQQTALLIAHLGQSAAADARTERAAMSPSSSQPIADLAESAWEDVLRGVCAELGTEFDLPALIALLERRRHRPINVEQEDLSEEHIRGECVLPDGVIRQLRDVDLIVTQAGTDPHRREHVLLHECAHLLLSDVPDVFGALTYDEYKKTPRQHRHVKAAAARSPLDVYENARERRAETLARALAPHLRRAKPPVPPSSKTVFG